MSKKIESVSVSMLLDAEGMPFGDVVVFRSGDYHRRYNFTPRLRYTRSISTASMVRAQRAQLAMISRPAGR